MYVLEHVLRMRAKKYYYLVQGLWLANTMNSIEILCTNFLPLNEQIETIDIFRVT